MKLWIFSLFIVLSAELYSCYPEVEFSIVPEISWEKAKFIDSPNSADSLMIYVHFTDGDGNLGIDSDENDSPFNRKFNYCYFDRINMRVKIAMGNSEEHKQYYNRYVFFHFETEADRNTFLNSDLLPDWNNTNYLVGPHGKEPYSVGVFEYNNGNFYQRISSVIDTVETNYITYRDKFNIAPLDTLPGFVYPYNCKNWEIIPGIDTLYTTSNPYYNNIYVNYYVEQGGEFKEFKWEDLRQFPDCGVNWNGRFPYLLTEEETDRPLQGEIRYTMNSTGFIDLFGANRIKLEIFIYDRDFNKSNVILTPAFRLTDIM